MPTKLISLCRSLLASLSVLVTALTVWFILIVSDATLIFWEGTAFIYICAIVVFAWYVDQRPVHEQPLRRDDKWTWCFPLITSLAGAQAALVAISASGNSKLTADDPFIAGASAFGVVLSWSLLHLGFADVYRVHAQRMPEPQFEFPNTTSPTRTEFIYLALTVGATFATSDVTILTSRARRIVTVHSVVGFFYNTLAIAVVFQVLNQLVSAL